MQIFPASELRIGKRIYLSLAGMFLGTGDSDAGSKTVRGAI